ncbi:YadA C-terminal domain-containing protein [Dialister sp.]|jgi:hypothetical protein|uniref:YadA C-terminal domain-containing protein n=1 Tax=Dialister sp. TaxID=1955814 RepID=UPI003A5C1C51
MIKSKKLSGLVLASMILAGGTVFGVQPAGAADDTAHQINELQQGVNSNRQRITQLENAQAASKDYSKDIAANTDGIAANKKAIGDNTTAIASNKSAIAAEKTARENGETSLNDRITNVKEYLQKDAADTYVTKDAAAVQDGAIVKAKDTIGNNVTNLDAGLAKETAARIGADKAQDKVIEQVNQNVATGFDNINKNIGTITTQLNQQDANEAAAREAADKTEAAARESGDNALNDRITNVKEYLQKDAADTYVTKADAAVKDGAIVKAKDTIGNNVTNLDAGLAKETAARIGADKAQDKAISTINTNMANGFDTLNKNIGTITTQLNQQDANEAAAREAADQKLQGNIDKAVNDQAAINKSVQDTLNSSGAVASADATKAANEAAAKASQIADSMKDRMDVISGNQDITSESDLIKKDQSIGQNLTNVDTALHKEIAARTAADKTLQDNIDKEAKARANADTTETNARTAADKTLQDNIDKEAKARADADTTETNARTAADKTLQDNIDKEAKARADADTTETNARTAADKTLQNNIDKEANDRAAAVTAEEAARTAADTKEANERTAADNALQTGLNKEIATREDAVTRLQNRIHDVSKEVDTVGALSMAMSGLHPLSYDEGDARFQLSAAVGTYDGTEALALGGFYHFNHDALLSVGVATDLGADEHRMGANIGYTRRIGHGGRVVNPSAGTVSDIMKDIQALKDKQAALEEENDNLKKQLAALQK